MKKINLIALVISVLLFSGCSDFLEYQNLDQYSETSVFKGEEDFLYALNHLYTFLPNLDTEGDKAELRFDTWTDDAIQRSVNGNVEGADFGWNINSGFLSDFYSYARIRDINEFLARIVDAEFKHEELRTQFANEARFFRAMIYARMVMLYGDVPLLKEPTEYDYFPARDPRKDVFDFVISELEDISTLPKKSGYAADMEGRITQGAVLALKARTYLNALGWYPDKEALYKGAADACKRIIDSEEYALENGIQGFTRQFFNVSDQNSTETILASIYVPNFRTHPITRRLPPKGTYRGIEGTATNQSRVGYTADLIEAFQTINGLFPKDDPTYDPANPFENRDPRLRASAFLPGDTLPINGSGAVTYVFQPHPSINPSGKADNITERVNPSGYNFKKYVDFGTVSNVLCDVDYKVIRYSEVLLMYAEALAGQGKDGEALSYLNMVRNRVGMPTYASGNLPVVTKGSTGNAMIDAILLERRYEFAGEGPQRFFDIWRYKLGSQVIPGMTYGIPESKTEPGDLVGEKYEVYSREWDDKFYLFPIPQNAMDANPNLAPNNPGW